MSTEEPTTEKSTTEPPTMDGTCGVETEQPETEEATNELAEAIDDLHSLAVETANANKTKSNHRQLVQCARDLDSARRWAEKAFPTEP
jgi:hypothetical protein